MITLYTELIKFLEKKDQNEIWAGIKLVREERYLDLVPFRDYCMKGSFRCCETENGSRVKNSIFEMFWYMVEDIWGCIIGSAFLKPPHHLTSKLIYRDLQLSN